MAVQRNDILWKGILEDFFVEFLRFIFKNADDIFDFSKGLRFLDNALGEIFPVQDLKHPKRIDKLAEIYTRSGAREWMLVHVEVQGYKQSIFAERMFTYYYRLLDKYKMPVTCVVIYLGRPGKSSASFYESECLGSKIRFDFNTYYVEDQDEAKLRKTKNPFAIVVLTALIALKHKRNIKDLYQSKITIARNLLQAGFSRERIVRLLDFIKLYVNFEQKELNDKFDKEIKLLTEQNAKNMGITEQILDIYEKRGLEKGLKKGLKKGMAKAKQAELKAKTTIARKLKSLGISARVIAKSTDLPLRQIKVL